jgi:hypothetical protein
MRFVKKITNRNGLLLSLLLVIFLLPMIVHGTSPVPVDFPSDGEFVTDYFPAPVISLYSNLLALPALVILILSLILIITKGIKKQNFSQFERRLAVALVYFFLIIYTLKLLSNCDYRFISSQAQVIWLIFSVLMLVWLWYLQYGYHKKKVVSIVLFILCFFLLHAVVFFTKPLVLGLLNQTFLNRDYTVVSGYGDLVQRCRFLEL